MLSIAMEFGRCMVGHRKQIKRFCDEHEIIDLR